MKKSLLIFMLSLALPIKAMQDSPNQQLLGAVLQENPNQDQIHALIAAKADVNHFPDSEAVLQMATAFGDLSTQIAITNDAKYLPNSRSLLHCAATFGCQKACIILLEAGANPNTQNNGYRTVFTTPLMAAINRDAIESIRLMIEKGAYINARDFFHCNALIVACHTSNVDVCRLLIEKRADVNSRTRVDHGTPLMTCISTANTPINIQVCKLLLRNGADLHARTKQIGTTALIMAAQSIAREPILAMLNHVLFPRKTEAQFFMYSLARLRTQNNEIANLLYRQAKSLLAPWLLYDIATKNKLSCVDLLQMRPKHAIRRAFEEYSISELNPGWIDETIQVLIQNQLGNTEL